MREIASLELHLAIKELAERIEGGYLRKFYEDGRDSFRIIFYKHGASTAVYCRLVKTFNATKYSVDAGPATQFAIAMRKRVENAKVSRIYQYGTERVIIVELAAGPEAYSIAIEMFGKGNLVLVKDGKIDLCYKRIIYKEREVRSKAVYPIAGGRMSIEETENSAVELIETACAEDDMLIRALSRYINVGPVYLDDALRSQGLDPKAKADSADRGAVAHAIAYLFDRLAEPEPIIYMKDGTEIDYSAYPLEKYSGTEKISFGSMNELLDEFNKNGRLGHDEESEKRAAEMEASVRKQRELAKRFAEEEIEYAEAGRKILENMNAINALIADARQRRKPSIDELNGSSAIKVISVDLKRKVLTIEL